MSTLLALEAGKLVVVGSSRKHNHSTTAPLQAPLLLTIILMSFVNLVVTSATSFYPTSMPSSVVTTTAAIATSVAPGPGTTAPGTAGGGGGQPHYGLPLQSAPQFIVGGVSHAQPGTTTSATCDTLQPLASLTHTPRPASLQQALLQRLPMEPLRA